MLLLLASVLARADEASDPLRDAPVAAGAPSVEASLGVATVVVPIEVPPGRRGLAPRLDLRYSSGAGNGNAGHGFSLTIGSIERSTRFGPPRFDDTDTFVLNLAGDSMELVPMDAGSTRFRTAIDRGFLLERLTPGPFGAGSFYWVARGRDGLRYRFGFVADAERSSQVSQFKWALDRVEDPNGNVMEMEWVVSGLHLFVTRIDYTSHPATGLPATNRVELCWEARGDQSPTSSGERLTHRLREIRTFAAEQAARSYTLRHLVPGGTYSVLGICRPAHWEPSGGSDPLGKPFPGPPPPAPSPRGAPRIEPGLMAETGGVDSGEDDPPATPAFPEEDAASALTLPLHPSYVIAIERGDGAGHSLPSIVYTYRSDRQIAWPSADPGYALPAPFLYSQDDADEDSGVRLVDLNRDGLQDLVQLEGRQQGLSWPTTAHVWINSGSGFVDSPLWSAGLAGLFDSVDPAHNAWFVIKRGTRDRVENGVRFLDVNDDGYLDVVRSVLWFGAGVRKAVFLNTGSGFARDTAASAAFPNEPFLDIHDDSGRDVAEDRGVRLADVNADGRIDLLVARAEWGGPVEKRIYLHDRGLYRLDTRWILPDVPFVRHIPHGRSLDMGVRLVELDGDGFPDLLQAANIDGMVSTRVYLNSTRPGGPASTWYESTRYGRLGMSGDYFVQISTAGDGAALDHGLRVTDIDGDGRSDIIAARRWNGASPEKFLYSTSPEGPFQYGVFNELPWLFVVKEPDLGPRDQGVRILDLDGDGGQDAVLAPHVGARESRRNRAWQGRVLLSSYSNGIGGTTTIEYAPAPHTGVIEGGGPSHLPFPLAVVATLTQSDGVGNSYTTSYSYDGGFHHHAAREFRGFRRAVTLPAGGEQSLETLFLQQPGWRHAPLRGAPEEQVVRRAADGAVFSRAVTSFDVTDGLPPLRHTPLRIETTLYEWTTLDPHDPRFVRRSATSWSREYDESSGPDQLLLTEIEHQEGDTQDPFDDRYLGKEYASRSDAAATGAAGAGGWILEVPWHQWLRGSDGNVVSEGWTAYDGQPLGQVGARGLITRTERRGGPPGPEGAHGPGDPDNPVVATQYDAYGHLAAETDPLGRIRRVERGAADSTHTFPEREIDPLGRVTTRRFDPRTGLVTKMTDPNGHAVELEYDGFGRRLAEWGPLDTAMHPTVSYQHDYTRVPAKVTRFAREVSGQGERTGTLGCLESSAFFDGLGRLLQVVREAPQGRVVTRAVTFDAAGRIATEAEPFSAGAGTGLVPVDAATHRRTLTYDTAGRAIAGANSAGETEQTEYAGALRLHTDPAGHRRLFEEDAFGHVVRVQEFEGMGGSAVPVPAATYRYDAAGRLVSITDPAGSTTGLLFDVLGRKTGLDDPHIGSWRYDFDLKGNLLRETDPMGQVTTLRYDPLDRLIDKTLADGSLLQWRYDDGGAASNALGRLTAIFDATGVQRFTYDPMGRVVSAWRFLFGRSFLARTTYDAMGRVASRTLPSGGRIDYLYDAGGDLASAMPFIQLLSHNERGQLTERVHTGETRVRHQYEAATGRPVGMTAYSPGGEVLLDLVSLFNADGHLATQTDRTNPDSPSHESFEYDGRHRLVRSTGPGGTLTYAYDDAGTMVLKDGVALQRDDAARPQWVTRTSSGAVVGYDAGGSVTTHTVPSGHRTMTYDARGRLTRLADPQQNLVVATDYDADGRPVRETTDRNGVPSVVLWPMPEVEVRDGRTTLHYFAGGQRVVSVDPDGFQFIPVLDHVGSARLVLTPSGGVAARAQYRPYGEAQAGSAEDPSSSFRFAGARRDGGGLLLMGWRHYDPALGRFLEPDPILAAPYDPQALNRYAYARDNPVNLTDPNGRNPIVAAVVFWGALMFLDRDTRMDVGTSVALTAASVFLTGWLGPGVQAGWAAVKASVPALYAAAASTVILESSLGRGLVDSYAILLQDLGVSPNTAQKAARLTTSMFLNSTLQRGFASQLKPGTVHGGARLGDRAGLDGALAERGTSTGALGVGSQDAYGATVTTVTSSEAGTVGLDRFFELRDDSCSLVGVYGVRDIGPVLNHGAVGFFNRESFLPAVTHRHYTYLLGGISTQQVARDLYLAGYATSLFDLTGRASDFLIEFVYGPYGGGLTNGVGAIHSTGDSGDGP